MLETTTGADVTTGVILTEPAANKLQEVLQQKGVADTHALRVFVQGGGCGGMQYGMTFDDSPRADDEISEQFGVKVIIDPISLFYINGARIDYVDSLMGGGFAIENPNAVAVGQRLMIPYHTSRLTPAQALLPDSELVYGPAYSDFDTEAFVAEQGGWLAGYSKPWFNGQTLTGAQLVDYVAMRYSVGPRVLLALLEARSGWVTTPEEPQGQAKDFPLGHLRNGGGLEVQLEWAADALNSGFYGWMDRGETAIRFRDYSIARGAPGLNPGTIAIQRTLAQDATFEGLPGELDAFMAAYQRLFGDPFQYDQGRVLPWELQQPPLAFPWEPGQWWYLTGGPHGAWGVGSSWAALDFVPEDAPIGGCIPAESWARAAAPGLVVRNNRGELLVDLDEDGDMRTGWVLQYLHIADRPPEGTRLQTGDPIGHPSCEGGRAASSHLHIARRYNGVWVAAGGPIPLQLDAWTAFAGNTAYEGGMTGLGGQKITACDCREKNINGIRIGR